MSLALSFYSVLPAASAYDPMPDPRLSGGSSSKSADSGIAPRNKWFKLQNQQRSRSLSNRKSTATTKPSANTPPDAED